jgi:hypothetical protein
MLLMEKSQASFYKVLCQPRRWSSRWRTVSFTLDHNAALAHATPHMGLEGPAGANIVSS